MKKKLSTTYVSHGILGIFFAVITLITNANTASSFKPLEIRTADQETIYADLYLPNKKPPRAIIVMVPGTAGLSDPYFIGSIKSSRYTPHYKGGLTQALTSNRFAFLSYNQRGYRRLNECVRGDNEFARQLSFSEKCILKNLRMHVDLKTITRDTLSVLLEAQVIARKMKAPMLVLSFSEGTYHVSKLLRINNIGIVGLIGVGSPITTLSETFEQQLREKYIFDVLENALKTCNLNGKISIDEVFNCSTKNISVRAKERLTITLGTGITETSEITKKKEHVNKIADDIIKYYQDLQSPHPISGWLETQELIENWSSAYFSEIFQERSNIYDNLWSANLPIQLIYGELDMQVQPPNSLVRGQNLATIDNRIEIKIIKNLDHYLSQDEKQISKSGLEQILASIRTILRVNKGLKSHSTTQN